LRNRNKEKFTMTRYENYYSAHKGRIKLLFVGAAATAIVGLAVSCAPAAPSGAPASGNPTVQAAATEVGGAARAVATAQGGIAQPTTAAAQTQVVSSAQGVGTAVAPTVQSARTAITTAVVGMATQVAPTVSAAQTQGAPTVAAAGTNAVATGATSQAQQATSVSVAREATATAVAPTAQAVATRVAPTVQAAATQVVAAVGTSVANSPVHVTNVSVNDADTIVSIQNTGAAPTTLSGWTLAVGPNMSVQLTDITLKAGQTRQLHFSQGTDTDNDVYLGAGYNVAKASLQPGTRVVLIAPADQIASVYPIS
jgi:hypothetical protein